MAPTASKFGPDWFRDFQVVVLNVPCAHGSHLKSSGFQKLCLKLRLNENYLKSSGFQKRALGGNHARKGHARGAHTANEMKTSMTTKSNAQESSLVGNSTNQVDSDFHSVDTVVKLQEALKIAQDSLSKDEEVVRQWEGTY